MSKYTIQNDSEIDRIIKERNDKYLVKQKCQKKNLEVNSRYNERSEEANIIQEINEKKPDILLVGMGVPRQEKWIARNLKSKQLNVPVCMGVGGSFDVLSGRIPRAPLWMQRHGMEWVYRFFKQPKRAFHTIALSYFILLVFMGKTIFILRNASK